MKIGDLAWKFVQSNTKSHRTCRRKCDRWIIKDLQAQSKFGWKLGTDRGQSWKSDLVNFRGPVWRKFSELCGVLFLLGKIHKYSQNPDLVKQISANPRGQLNWTSPIANASKEGILKGRLVGRIFWSCPAAEISYPPPYPPFKTPPSPRRVFSGGVYKVCPPSLLRTWGQGRWLSTEGAPRSYTDGSCRRLVLGVVQASPPNPHSPVWAYWKARHSQREGTNLGVFIPPHLVLTWFEGTDLG